ncbi:SAF domain-containing protein [Blastococcus sp. PRF04-17]|uniref:SAF domain-containing protein n=1 Tax=Blastococcus sp. PRF04-17 TaxID=2933797 RepID=UPI001FF1420E|nr:SAF domain-containing protein [Blastococcus sp. PRF04-17]UOY03234.1 SAF domain-containing protein [Blastococcus sp. PRF04-17]
MRSAAARRRASRKSLVLSVLVVLLGGLLAFAAGQMLTARTEVLAVARDVQMGSTITAEDLAVANVTSDPNLSPIPASQRSQIVGMVAQVPLSRGELLTGAQVGPDSGFAAGEMLVALPMREGQFPSRGLNPGQQVLIVATPGSTGSTSGSGIPTGETNGAPDQPIDATVVEVGPLNQATQLTVIDVRVSADDGVRVAELASTGNLALILLPAGR